MNQEELIQKWEEIQQQAFHDFIAENIGFNAETDAPECYGTGDSKAWCLTCSYRSSC